MLLRLSIFEECMPHPQDRDLKAIEARKTSNPHLPTTVEVRTSDQLLDVITNYAWSPATFTKYRRRSDFISTEFMVLDIDNELTIEDAEKRCYKMDVFAIIAPTPNFTPDHHKFRVVFPLVKPIKKAKDFEATWKYLAAKFPEIDEQCSDSCRFYFGSTLEDGCFVEGSKLLEPVTIADKPTIYESSRSKLVKPDVSNNALLMELYGKVPTNVPECIDYFLTNAQGGLEGNWITTLNSFTFVLSLQGVELEKIIDVVESIAPDDLDERDDKAIQRAFRDGAKSRKEVL